MVIATVSLMSDPQSGSPNMANVQATVFEI